MAGKKAPKHNSKHNDEMFRKTFEEGFRKQFQNGLLTGSRAICKVVFDKADDEKKTIQERIDDIKKFCNVLLGLPVKEDETPVEPEETETSQPE